MRDSAKRRVNQPKKKKPKIQVSRFWLANSNAGNLKDPQSSFLRSGSGGVILNPGVSGSSQTNLVFGRAVETLDEDHAGETMAGRDS